MSRRQFRQFSFLGIFLALLLSFQNCGQSPQVGVNSSSSNQFLQAAEGEGSFESVALDENVDRIEVPESPELEQTLRGISSKAVYSGERLFISQTLFIDPQTGLIDVVDAQNGESVGQNFCLKQEQVNQLQGILAAARICESKRVESAGQVCTMEYEFPYAKLHLLNQKVHLGERFSGCDQGTDLCGEYSVLMRNFISEVKSQLADLKCEFTGL